jgi:CRP-like cAMP-binding protein
MISPESLRRLSCFSPISEASLKRAAMIAREETVPAGTRLFNEGDPADTLGIILSGEVDIQYTLPDGERRTVDTLIAGDIVGWSALVPPHKLTASATTCKETKLIKVEAKRLRELCEEDPLLGYRLMTQVAKLLADRLDGARVQLAVV